MKIEIPVATVESRIEWLRISEAERIVRLRERRAQIVQRMRVRVIRYQAQPGIAEIGGLELDIQRLIVRVAIGASVIDIGVLADESCQSGVSTDGQWVAEQHVASAKSIYILDVIQMEPASARILQ